MKKSIKVVLTNIARYARSNRQKQDKSKTKARQKQDNEKLSDHCWQGMCSEYVAMPVNTDISQKEIHLSALTSIYLETMQAND